MRYLQVKDLDPVDVSPSKDMPREINCVMFNYSFKKSDKFHSLPKVFLPLCVQIIMQRH